MRVGWVSIVDSSRVGEKGLVPCNVQQQIVSKAKVAEEEED
jgi:hypothetical protein